MPRIPVDDDLRAIATEIVDLDHTEPEWAGMESDDMFQRGRYTGGYVADEHAFLFSRHADDGELWLQFTLREAHAIASGQEGSVAAEHAES